MARSRILDAGAHVDEDELARLAAYGEERADPRGGREVGLTKKQIKTFMKDNLVRAGDKRRWYYKIFMQGEWPILLRIMGKDEGKHRYLSVPEVTTLFVERRLPDRIVERLTALPARAPARGPLRKVLKVAVWVIAVAGALLVAIAEFPDQIGKVVPPLAELLPPPLPDSAPARQAHWLDQDWSTQDRHWFHHASQGTATFPVPYAWFLALEQPGIHLFTKPGLLSDSTYLERFGFLPSPKSIDVDEASLVRFGYAPSPEAKTEPAPASLPG